MLPAVQYQPPAMPRGEASLIKVDLFLLILLVFDIFEESYKVHTKTCRNHSINRNYSKNWLNLLLLRGTDEVARVA